MHDHFRPYCGRMDKVAHAFCNAHILRELEGLIEFDSEPWPELMRDLLLEANAAVREARGAGAKALAPEGLRPLSTDIGRRSGSAWRFIANCPSSRASRESARSSAPATICSSG